MNNNEINTIYTITPIAIKVNKNNGQYTKLFLVVIDKDGSNNTYIVNSPYSELSNVKKAMRLAGWYRFDISMPVLDLKNFKNLEIISEYDLKNILKKEYISLILE